MSENQCYFPSSNGLDVSRPISLSTRAATPAWQTSACLRSYRVLQISYLQARLCKAARSDGWVRNSSVPSGSALKTVIRRDIQIATPWEWLCMRFSVGASHFTRTRIWSFSGACLKANALRGLEERRERGSRMMCGGYWNVVGYRNHPAARVSRTYSSVWRRLQGVGYHRRLGR